MNFEIAHRTSNELFIGSEERVYKVDSSGASISSAYSISLLHQYCSKLPHDEYVPMPNAGFSFCPIILDHSNNTRYFEYCMTMFSITSMVSDTKFMSGKSLRWPHKCRTHPSIFSSGV